MTSYGPLKQSKSTYYSAPEGPEPPGHVSLDSEVELEGRSHNNYDQYDVGDEYALFEAAEPRDVYKMNHMEKGKKPSNNLKCLWISILLLYILAIVAALCIDQFVVNIYGYSSEAGWYFWGFGWNSGSFHPEDTGLTAESIPLQFTKRYLVDSGRLFIISSLIVIVCLSAVVVLLCARCTNEVYLYILCCHIRIPQTPALIVLFSTMKHFSRLSVYFYFFVILYGMLEMNFYHNFQCQVLGGSCSNFAIPQLSDLRTWRHFNCI